MKTITVQDDTWRRLTLLKYNLNLRSLDDLLNIYLGLESEIVDSRGISDEIDTWRRLTLLKYNIFNDIPEESDGGNQSGKRDECGRVIERD
ncbi:MAG: hypothetical protein EHM20_01995 [Alphaproteobacteria bacterium]|nr:MAG: hypothetical protein EHM20_01995 [Alphaproteobacteria bacterium]